MTDDRKPSDLPESLIRARDAALGLEQFRGHFVPDESAALDERAVRAQEYIAEQTYRLREYAESIAHSLEVIASAQMRDR